MWTNNYCVGESLSHSHKEENPFDLSKVSSCVHVGFMYQRYDADSHQVFRTASRNVRGMRGDTSSENSVEVMSSIRIGPAAKLVSFVAVLK